MNERFRAFPAVSGRYGAPMGRASSPLDCTLSPAELCAAGPAHEYDSGGAYWGTGGTDGPVWAVWHRGHGHDGVAYVRAHSAKAAKAKAVEL